MSGTMIGAEAERAREAFYDVLGQYRQVRTDYLNASDTATAEYARTGSVASEDAVETASGKHSDALHALLMQPAGSPAQVAAKLEVIFAEEVFDSYTQSHEVFASLVRDARAVLAGRSS